jgi:hypothetical protein
MPGQVAQMFEQALDPLKGWFHLSALDKSAPLDATLLASATATPAGRVAVINDDGDFVLDRSGLSNTDTAMPIFLWNGSDHPDVYNDGTSPLTDTVHWWGISPTGVMSGLVATGGYELQTTEFDDTQTYIANDLLTASSAGVLTNQSAQADNQTAAATSPVGTNAHGVSVLSFWTYFLPASS